MTVTITAGASTIIPTITMGYESGRDAGNIVHPILGRANPDVTLRPAATRSGTLTFGFAGPTSEADSKTAETLHATGVVFTLADPERLSVAMSYVVSGRVSRALEDATRNAWILTVDYTEVIP